MLPYEFTQKVSEREFILVVLRRRYRRLSAWFSTIMFLGFAAYELWRYYQNQPYVDLAPTFYLAVFFLLYVPIRLIFFARQQYRSMRAIQAPITYTITESKLQTDSSGDMSEMSWGNFINRVELGGYLLLYVSNTLMIILKKPLLSLEALAFIRGKVPL